MFGGPACSRRLLFGITSKSVYRRHLQRQAGHTNLGACGLSAGGACRIFFFLVCASVSLAPPAPGPFCPLTPGRGGALRDRQEYHLMHDELQDDPVAVDLPLVPELFMNFLIDFLYSTCSWRVTTGVGGTGSFSRAA